MVMARIAVIHTHRIGGLLFALQAVEKIFFCAFSGRDMRPFWRQCVSVLGAVCAEQEGLGRVGLTITSDRLPRSSFWMPLRIRLAPEMALSEYTSTTSRIG